MSNVKGRLTMEYLTNKSGGSVVYGAVVVIDTANAASFVTDTSGAFKDGQIGVVLEPAGIANNAVGLIAFGGVVEQINLDASANVGDFIQTDTVAGQGTPHAAPVEEGDFAQALETGTTPRAILFGSVQQGGGGVTGVPEVDPTDITGCTVWMDANQDSNVDGDLIASWTDRSSSANHATEATNNPTFRENVFNEKPALFFDGVNDVLTFGTNIIHATPTIFVVCNRYHKLGYTALATNQKFGIYSILNGASWGLYNDGERVGGANLTHEPVLLTVLYNGASDILLFTNGQKIVASGGNSAASGTSRIGYDGSGSQFHFGYIAELIIFDNIISESDRLALTKHLLFKWGISGVRQL